MNYLPDTQSDLEVILEFLEEYYRQSNGEHVDEVYRRADEESCDQWWTCQGPPPIKPLALEPVAQAREVDTTASLCEPKCLSPGKPTKPRARAPGRGGKVRLFHFLFEMLEDPSMAQCVSWVPAAAGVFRFSSSHKDRVATLWGQRKGNKRPMTYQKMSRALRNYAHSGQIVKVKKKLTYQFSRDTLTLLRGSKAPGHL